MNEFLTFETRSTSVWMNIGGLDMLKHFTYVVATALALGSPMSVSAPAHAQGVAAPIELPAVTQEQVLAACTAADAKEETCNAAIAAYFAYLKQTNVTGGDLEKLIADLVEALAVAPATGAVKSVVVAAIQEIGNNYATGDQAEAILKIAQTVQKGGAAVEGTSAIPVSGA